MGDLISRSDVVELFFKEFKNDKDPYKAGRFIAGLKYVPTVEAEPVVHGMWIEKEDVMLDTYYDCSVCGESFCTIEGTPVDNMYNYCPNCGAKMDGGVSDD